MYSQENSLMSSCSPFASTPLSLTTFVFISIFMSTSSWMNLQVIFHFLHLLKYILFSYFSLAHRCPEPQEGGILLRPIWVVGGWSGAEVPLWHPLLHLQLHPDVATSYGKYNVYNHMYDVKMFSQFKIFCNILVCYFYHSLIKII